MTDWIDFVIQVTFLIWLWFLMPRAIVHQSIAKTASRNPELLATQPGWQKSLNDNRWYLWTSYGMGTLLIAALASFQLHLWSLDQIGWVPAPFTKSIALGRGGLVTLSVFINAAITLAWAIGFTLTWRDRLPPAPRRHASLEVRQFGTYIPAWLWVLTTSLMILSLTAWAAFALLGGSRSKIGWIFFAGQVLYILILLGGTFWSVRRPPSLLDRYFGPHYRRRETQGFVWSIAVLSMLNLLVLAGWLMKQPQEPFYYSDLILLLWPLMFLAGAISNKLNARTQAQDQGRQGHAP